MLPQAAIGTSFCVPAALFDAVACRHGTARDWKSVIFGRLSTSRSCMERFSHCAYGPGHVVPGLADRRGHGAEKHALLWTYNLRMRKSCLRNESLPKDMQ
jgi:hypothetical protein